MERRRQGEEGGEVYLGALLARVTCHKRKQKKRSIFTRIIYDNILINKYSVHLVNKQ